MNGGYIASDDAIVAREKYRRIDVQSTLAFLVTAGFFGCVAVYLWKPPTSDAGTLQMLSLLIGGVAAKFGDVIAYYFNTSKTSKDSNETLATVTKSLVSSTGNGASDTTKVVVTPPTPGVTTVDTRVPDPPAGRQRVKTGRDS